MPNSNKPDEAVGDNGQVATAARSSDIEQLQEQLRREHEMYLRALADFDNFRRRVERDRAEAAHRGKREIILAVLDALDGFDRALQQMSAASPAVFEGLEAIRRKMLAVLEREGVVPFNSVGDPFNPELHEAVAAEKTDAYEPGVVVEELQRGYRWGGAVLRPARVRVAQ